MFRTLKCFRKNDQAETEQYNIQAQSLAEELTALENKLTGNSKDSEIQKILMLRYNQAVKVYAKSRTHRQHIDALFVKMDELRNIIRKTI